MFNTHDPVKTNYKKQQPGGQDSDGLGRKNRKTSHIKAVTRFSIIIKIYNLLIIQSNVWHGSHFNILSCTIQFFIINQWLF